MVSIYDDKTATVMAPCVGSLSYIGPSNTPDYVDNVPALVPCPHKDDEYCTADAYTEHTVVFLPNDRIPSSADFTSVIGESTESVRKVPSIKGKLVKP